MDPDFTHKHISRVKLINFTYSGGEEVSGNRPYFSQRDGRGGAFTGGLSRAPLGSAEGLTGVLLLLTKYSAHSAAGRVCKIASKHDPAGNVRISLIMRTKPLPG